MPRNSSGTMTLPAGNPVIPGTVISTTTHNSTMADIAVELTDSASRSGKGGFTAPVRTSDGTQAAPSHAFTSDTDTGFFLKGVANPAVTVGNAEKQEWTAVGSKVTGTLEVTGASTLTGNVHVGGTLDVDGATLNLGAAAVTDDGAGNLGFGAKKLTGVADPGEAQDAATRSYVDTRTLLIRKAADQAFSVTTPADVTSLGFAVEANADYEFELFAVFTTAATTTGIGMRFTTPAAISWYLADVEIQNTDAPGFSRNIFATTSGVTQSAAPSSRGVIRGRGIIRNGANAGTFQVQANSEVNASDVTILAGSFVRYRKTS